MAGPLSGSVSELLRLNFKTKNTVLTDGLLSCLFHLYSEGCEAIYCKYIIVIFHFEHLLMPPFFNPRDILMTTTADRKYYIFTVAVQLQGRTSSNQIFVFPIPIEGRY